MSHELYLRYLSCDCFFRKAYNLSLSQYFVSVMLNYTEEIGIVRTQYFVNSGWAIYAVLMMIIQFPPNP